MLDRVNDTPSLSPNSKSNQTTESKNTHENLLKDEKPKSPKSSAHYWGKLRSHFTFKDNDHVLTHNVERILPPKAMEQRTVTAATTVNTLTASSTSPSSALVQNKRMNIFNFDDFVEINEDNFSKCPLKNNANRNRKVGVNNKKKKRSETCSDDLKISNQKEERIVNIITLNNDVKRRGMQNLNSNQNHYQYENHWDAHWNNGSSMMQRKFSVSTPSSGSSECSKDAASCSYSPFEGSKYADYRKKDSFSSTSDSDGLEVMLFKSNTNHRELENILKTVQTDFNYTQQSVSNTIVSLKEPIANHCNLRLRDENSIHKIRPCSDAFIPQPQNMQQTLKNLSLSQAELNKFDDIISKFDRIPPRNSKLDNTQMSSLQFTNTLNRKSSTLNRYRKSNNQNLMDNTSIIKCTAKSNQNTINNNNNCYDKDNEYEKEKSFQDNSIKLSCKNNLDTVNGKCCLGCRQQSPHSPHSQPQHFYVSTMKKYSRPHPINVQNNSFTMATKEIAVPEESPTGIRELLNSCQLHASSCGNLSNGSAGTNSGSPINLTTNPIDSTICCTQPRATIVVQQVFLR